VNDESEVLADEEDSAPTPSPNSKPRIITVANQKGGVAKTTTAVNLGAALGEMGYRVGLVDLDPQANATTGVGLNPEKVDVSMYDVLLQGATLDECMVQTEFKNLSVAPATVDLAGAEVELVPVMSREMRLRQAAAKLPPKFDFIFVDCPPSLGLLTINGFTVADEILVPIQCEYYALEGVGQLIQNVDLVKTHLNPDLVVSTVVLTMYDARTKLASQVAQEVRNYFGDKVCRTVIPRSVRLSEAPSFGQPINIFDPMSRGAIAYRELAQEVSNGIAS
jgi:chromosome partitioning protein